MQWGTQGMKAVLQHRRQFRQGVPVGLLCWGSGSRRWTPMVAVVAVVVGVAVTGGS